MKLVKTNIVDLQEGLVLGQDLYVENRLLMKKGSVITARIITLLKNRHVHDVYIQTRIVETDLQAEKDGLLGVKLHENTIVNSETENSLFLQALGELSTDSVWSCIKKYGRYTIYTQFISTLYGKWPLSKTAQYVKRL